MGIKEKIRKFFGFKTDIEALQSDLKRFSSDLKRSNERFKALESASNFDIYKENKEKNEQIYEKYEDMTAPGLTQLSRQTDSMDAEKPIELQKESIQLGVAAGYAGKAIKDIESSLNRIESHMASKDWFLSNFEGKTNRSLELLSDIKIGLENHDSSASKRLDAIQSALNRLSNTARTAPEPIRNEIMTEIESIETNLPLTPKMNELVDIVKTRGKISYDDMVDSLGVSRSSLRGLLSNTMKRTDELERYSVDGKGWIRYKTQNTSQIINFTQN